MKVAVLDHGTKIPPPPGAVDARENVTATVKMTRVEARTIRNLMGATPGSNAYMADILKRLTWTNKQFPPETYTLAAEFIHLLWEGLSHEMDKHED